MKKTWSTVLLWLGVLFFISSIFTARRVPAGADNDEAYRAGYYVGLFLPGTLCLIVGLVLRRGKTPAEPAESSLPPELDEAFEPAGRIRRIALPDTQPNRFGLLTNLCSGIGILTMFTSGQVVREWPELLPYTIASSLVGWALLIWGCVSYMRLKGRSGWFGLLGYLLLLGLLILVFFPNRRKALLDPRRPHRDVDNEAEDLAAYDRIAGYRYLLTLLPLGLIAVVAFTLIGSRISAVQAADWVDVDHPELRFRVQMPGTPKLEEKLTPTPNGNIELHKFMVQPRGKNELYMIVSVRFPQVVGNNLGGAEKILELGRKDLLAAAQGEIRSERGIDLKGRPGLEVEVAPKTGAVVKSRIFATKNQIYQVTVHVPLARLGSEDVAKFLDSFQLPVDLPAPENGTGK